MGKKIAALIVCLIVATAFNASGAGSSKTNKSATSKSSDNPIAEIGQRKVYVITDGGVGYDLKLTLIEFIAALNKNNKYLSTKWKKVNANFWVYNTSGVDPMSDRHTKVNFGFQTVADNREYILLSAINVIGVAASPNEIVAFGLVIAPEDDSDNSEDETE